MPLVGYVAKLDKILVPIGELAEHNMSMFLWVDPTPTFPDNHLGFAWPHPACSVIRCRQLDFYSE